jgi:hypothetical protein
MAVCRVAVQEERRFPLFDLPRELRDWVFDYVISDPWLVPANAAAATSEVDVQTIHFGIERPRLTSMCLVSKQFQYEYLQRVDRQTTIIMLDHKDFQFADYHPNGTRFQRIATTARHLEIRMFATCANMCGDMADECDILRLEQFLSESLPRFNALQTVVVRMGIWSSEQAMTLEWPASEHSKNLQEFLEKAKITALAKLSRIEVYNSEREWQDFETAFCSKRLSATWTLRGGWKPIIRPKKKRESEKPSLDQADQQAAQVDAQATVTTASTVSPIADTHGTGQHLITSSHVDTPSVPTPNMTMFNASVATADRLPSMLTDFSNMTQSSSVTNAATVEDEMTVASILAETSMMTSATTQTISTNSAPSSVVEALPSPFPFTLSNSELYTEYEFSPSDLAWVDLRMNTISAETEEDTESSSTLSSPPATPSSSEDTPNSPITPMTELSSPDLEMRTSISIGGPLAKSAPDFSGWTEDPGDAIAQQLGLTQDLASTSNISEKGPKVS